MSDINLRNKFMQWVTTDSIAIRGENDSFDTFKAGYHLSQKENAEKIEKLKKALEFYADIKNWHTWKHPLMVLIDGEDAESIEKSDCEYFDCGGRIARQILKEIE
jgi:hypothetical protein